MWYGSNVSGEWVPFSNSNEGTIWASNGLEGKKSRILKATAVSDIKAVESMKYSKEESISSLPLLKLWLSWRH